MILIVDDNIWFIATMHGILSERGYRFEIAMNGDEAIALTLDHGQRYAIALIDVDLKSNLSGIDVVRLIRANPDSAKANVPVVMITGVAEIDSKLVDELHLSGVLYKPFLIADLITAIKTNTRYPLTPETKKDENP